MNESRPARRCRYAEAIRSAGSVRTACVLLEGYVAIERETGPRLLDELRELPKTYAALLAWALARRPEPSRTDRSLRATDLLNLRRHSVIGWLAIAAEAAWEQGRQLEAAELWGAVQTATLQLIGRDTMIVAFTDPRGDGHAEEEDKKC